MQGERNAMTAAAFDTLKAARDLEAAGVEQRQAEAIAAAIRAGQGELATRADLSGLSARIGALQWVIGLNVAISLATLAGVLAIAFRP
jgi:hypothetical protein